MSGFTPSPASVEAIAQRVAQIVAEKLSAAPAQPVRPESPIMTRSEAKAYVRRESEGAFVAWCRKWKVKPHARGRYSRAQLDLVLARETGQAHTPATLRRHQQGLA